MGYYGDLVELLKNTAPLQNVDIHLGQEFIYNSALPYPRITIFPTLGILDDGVGYAEPDAPDANMRWDLNETLIIHCMARGAGDAPSVADNFSACELLRAQVLQGLQEQRFHFSPDVGAGFYVDITSRKGYWDSDQSIIKVCRAYVWEVKVKISITDQLPTAAPIRSVGITESFTE